MIKVKEKSVQKQIQDKQKSKTRKYTRNSHKNQQDNQSLDTVQIAPMKNKLIDDSIKNQT